MREKIRIWVSGNRRDDRWGADHKEEGEALLEWMPPNSLRDVDEILGSDATYGSTRVGGALRTEYQV